MGYQPLEELLPKANNSVYTLVRLASKRAVELGNASANLVSAPINQKLTTTALEEIRAGKVIDKRSENHAGVEKTTKQKKNAKE